MGEDRRELEERLARLGAERLAGELLDLADDDRDIARRVKLLVREGSLPAIWLRTVSWTNCLEVPA